MKDTHPFIKRFAAQGFRLIPLFPGESGEGKTPGAGWPDTPYIKDIDLKKFPNNYGVVLDPGHVVIDVDPRNGGAESWKKLQYDIGLDLAKMCGFSVMTGGGGGHFYFTKPDNFPIVEKLDRYPGLEMKTKGRQVVGPGSQNYKTKKFYKVKKGRIEDISDIPHKVLDIFKRERKAQVLTKGLKEYNDSEANIQFVRELLAAHLPALEGQRGDETTYKAVCVCVEYGLSPQTALDLMFEYNERCEPPWSAEALEQKVGNGYRYAQNAVGSKDPSLDFENIQKKEKLPGEASAEYKEVASKNFYEEIRDNWVYVMGVKRFVDLDSLMELDKEQFDDKFARMSLKVKPSKAALLSDVLRKVDFQTYAPGRDILLMEDKGKRLNMWRGTDVIAMPGDVTPFLDFVNYLVGPDKAWIIHDYIAYLVREPGEKILWVPLIKGSPGIGKSILGRAVEAVLGSHNVKRPSNAQLHEQFTSFMKECQLCIVEELMATGRLQLLNKLKDLITEPYIQIREMYKNPYKIPNRANFMMFTNHDDSIVIPNDDRRFAVLFSKAVPKDSAYYKELVEWIKDKAYALLDYYQHAHVMNPAFLPKGHAPWTTEKEILINLTRHPVESQLLDWKEDQVHPMYGRIANFSEIMTLLKPHHRNLTNTSLASHMRACGFISRGRIAIESKGRTHLWVVRPESPRPAEYKTWLEVPEETIINMYKNDLIREEKRNVREYEDHFRKS